MSAQDLSQSVLLRVNVVGESQQKALHTKFAAACSSCQESVEIDLLSGDLRNVLMAILTKPSEVESIARRLLPGANGNHRHKWSLQPAQATDYRVLKIRDLVGFEETVEKTLVARDYRAYSLSGVSAEKKLLIDGEVLIDPSSHDLVLLVTHAAALGSSIDNVKLTDSETNELRSLQSLDYEGLLTLADNTIAPTIRGRATAKLVSLLTALSVNWFKVAGSEMPVPGCVRSLLCGDKRCGKGTIIRWWHDHAALGEHGIGEAASRAGLLYFVDTESNILVWGLLPQADLGLALIEALHGVPREQLAEFREALVQQKITVQKKVTGEAWVRVRILADANPQKDLKEFVFPCQALTSIRCFLDPVDLTRWDLFVPFDADEVPIEEITRLEPRTAPGMPVETLRKLAMWAWSRRIDHVQLRPQTLERAKHCLTSTLSKYRVGEIPLVHNASLWSILRVSIAFAIATFSTVGDDVVTVTEKHVEMTERLCLELLQRWGLDDYVEFTGTKPLSQEELEEHTAWISGKEVAAHALRELSSRAWQGRDLAERISCDYGSLRNVMSEMKGRDLVNRRPDGYNLTRKGAAVAKHVLMGRASEGPGSTGLAEQTTVALGILREMIDKSNGDNPPRTEFIERIRTNGISDPERLVEFLKRESHVYEPIPGRIRPTRL